MVPRRWHSLTSLYHTSADIYDLTKQKVRSTPLIKKQILNQNSNEKKVKGLERFIVLFVERIYGC